MKKYAVGADIGGGHITTAVINFDNASIVSSNRIDVNEQGDAESILSAWENSINTSVENSKVPKTEIVGVGLAMPGPFDYPNGISLPKEHKFVALNNMNIRNELAKRTGFEPANIRFKNDAECFLLGEVFGRKDEKIRRAIGVPIGTGLGSAYYFDGISEDANLWCAPFKGGIAEDSISTRWFVKRYEELTGKKITGAKEVEDNIKEKNQDAAVSQQIFDEFAAALCEFLLPLAEEKQADTIIIGGNIAKGWTYFIKPLENALSKTNTQVLKAKFGEEAALIGSASLLK